jgi:hypothetical protein
MTLKKSLLALAALLCVLGIGLGALLLRTPPPPPPPSAPSGPDFKDWAVLLVAGDYRAHSGAPSPVFDNARKDLAKAFTKIGFSPANMAQFSVDFDANTQHSDPMDISIGLSSVTAHAKAGCLIYFTSHGTPTGIVIGDGLLPPPNVAELVNQNCARRPSVIVMSSCFSGQFVPALAGDNRMVLTAARPDRTSFGCGENDHYTYFDDCFLRAMPMADDFPGLGELVRECVAERERLMHAAPPSEPQLSVGNQVLYTLRWK